MNTLLSEISQISDNVALTVSLTDVCPRLAERPSSHSPPCRAMARDQQPEEQRTRKSVRFNECPGPAPSGLSVGMVQSLVSQLPGLDPESLYVISGPFPQQNQNTNTSNMVIMATPVPAGVTVVAVPSGQLPTKGAREKREH